MMLLFRNINESIFSIPIPKPDPIITDAVRRWLNTLLNIPMFAFSLLGVVTNCVSMRVFIKQGLASDSNTIGLFALAIADYLGCLTLFPYAICDFLEYIAPRATVLSCASFTSVSFFVSHAMMSRITCWVTVYIAIERCLCVLLPFKVKTLLRPRVTTTAMTCIYVTFTALYLMVFLNFGIQLRYHSELNTTVIFITETAMAGKVAKYMGLVTNTIMSTIALIIIAMATGLMLYKLNDFQKWRMKTASAGRGMMHGEGTAHAQQPQGVGQGKRDVEVLKTVLLVTGLFLVCLSMSHFPGFAAAVLPGFSFTGVNRNAFVVFYRYKCMFDVINSSLNFFFYIRTSSRFKAAYGQVFGKQK